jgi:hypothetical protein
MFNVFAPAFNFIRKLRTILRDGLSFIAGVCG